MSSGQQPVTQQTTQTKDPWSGAVPALTQVQGAASGLYNANVGYQNYPNPMQAALNPLVPLATNAWANTAAGELGGTAGVNAARDLGLQQLQNYGLSPQLQSLYEQAQGDQNPYLEGVIRQGVNAANAGASGMGRYGSGGHDAAITQAMSPVLAQDYTRRQQQMQGIAEGGLQRAGQWSQAMPTLDAARFAGAKDLMGLGQYYTDREQQNIDNEIKKWNASQSRDWEQLARYNAIAGGAGGLGGQQVTSSPIQNPSTLQRLLGGATAGAGVGSIFGAPGAAVGAGAGSLLGLL